MTFGVVGYKKGALWRREPIHVSSVNLCYDNHLVGRGGLSAIIRLENKLPPTATGHPMNLLTACRCP
ncbi:hypothetical protein T03_12406 [Trichinella britovi]|uniref:Uncharacterized protein n=1 Tax=Trichinella britovi TaxID=45882 RepID=A0A0V1CBU8_TRIBR|nr:hypothetical protein T03_12406 [Trichinella britovi]